MFDPEVVKRLKNRAGLESMFGEDERSHSADLHAIIAEWERLQRLHEALLNTLTPSKSSWIQHVVRNARAALKSGGA